MSSSRVSPGSRAASATGASAGDREVIRLAPPVVLWWGWIAFVALNVVDYAVQGLPSARFGAVISAIMLLVTALAYTLALRPRVVLDAGGLTVVNPFRAHRVPWRLITSVDTGEWVRVRYGDGRKLECWALYVSARAKRKIAGGPKPRRGLGFGSRATARWLEGDSGSGYGSARSSPRLPDEARALASLPVATALAVRLDRQAERERARKPGAGDGSAESAAASASWSWAAMAAVAVPALILLAVVVG